LRYLLFSTPDPSPYLHATHGSVVDILVFFSRRILVSSMPRRQQQQDKAGIQKVMLMLLDTIGWSWESDKVCLDVCNGAVPSMTFARGHCDGPVGQLIVNRDKF
jgi:hypothetical protein